MSMEIKVPIEKLRQRKLFVATPMYGGQCAGMFARSIADLSALCTHYGIQVRFYFLFNESLITRARNYCADEFMRSGDTHLMFIDSDIGFNANDVIALLALQSEDPEEDQYDILAGPYPKKCLHHKTTIQTEDGVKTISSIVKEKYNGKVLAFDDINNQPVWKNITNWWQEPNNGKKQWVSIQTQQFNSTSKMSPRGDLIVTADHDVAYIDDVLNPVIKYGRADSITGKYLVKTPKQSKTQQRRYSLLNKQQISVLIGSSLGDGCVTNGVYVAGHSNEQVEYNRYKYDVIGGKFNTRRQNRHSFVNGQTQHLGDILYDGRQKTIKNVIGYIDDIALAHLYMDDGNRYYYPELVATDTTERSWWYNNITGETVQQIDSPGDDWSRGRKKDAWRPTSSIATMSLTKEDNELLIAHLYNKFGITAELRGAEINRYWLRFDQDNTDKLHGLIAQYIHPSMRYKLNEQFRDVEFTPVSGAPLEFAAEKVLAVNHYECKFNSSLFDIEVEDTHNFFANDGVLVHNCISWEKIKTAVDKGFADENPQNLEKYVGDYVFNPANGSTSIPLGQPVEVLEAGTGFMMIRRNTFLKFEKEYPQQSYKPDHVRTEHFDGSREIFAFFDTPIDGKRVNINTELKLFLENNPEATHEEILNFVVDPNNGVVKDYSKRYLSEDYMFCQWTRNANLKVWLCPWMQLQHVGMYVFGGSLVDLAQIGAAATADVNQIKRK